MPYLLELYRELTNESIEDENFRIGPSQFMRVGLTEEELQRIWKHSVVPYLEEYHFDKPERAQLWSWDGERVTSIRGRHLEEGES